MTRRSSLVALILATAPVQGFADPIQRTSDPCLSPDGATIAFSWQGDIWTVPATGGTAIRLTVNPADDTMPRWSPDGRLLYFASTRDGSLDVFSMTPQGTGIRRLTYDSAAEYPISVSPDGKTLYGYTTAFGRIDLFQVPTTGGDIVRLTGSTFEMEFYPSPSPDGKLIAYNTSGGPGDWRKPGHEGADTARIWVAETGTPLRQHRLVFPGDREDLFPIFINPTTLAFVSNRSGCPNIWTGSLSGGSLRQVTKFTDGTIRLPSADKAGNQIAFQKDSRIWIANVKTGDAHAVTIEAPADTVRDPEQQLSLNTGASQITVSPNGKRAVLVIRGDLFLIPEKGGTTRRLTTSPRLDDQPVWIDDKTILYVAAGEESKRSLWTVDIDGRTKSFLSDAQDLTCPTLSPDRKTIAFHRGVREICLVPVGGGNPAKIAEGDFGDALTGNRSFNWSPDSQWIVYRHSLQRGVEVAMEKADGARNIVVARIGKYCSTPVFSADGKAVAFSATEGLDFSEVRDSKAPLSVVDLVPQPVTYSEDDLDKIDSPKEEPSKDVVVKVVQRGLLDRRRTLATGDIGGLWPAADGRTVYANVDGQFSTVDLKRGEARPVAGITGAVTNFELASNKQKSYVVQAGKASALVMQSGAVSPIGFNAQFTINVGDEEKALFDEVWWAMDRMYYNPAMNGKDWEGIRAKYAQIVPGVQSREDFYALMGEMMELLDSSHLGSTAPAGTRSSGGDETGWFGVEWDWSALAARGVFVVAKVYEGTPAALPDTELRVGDEIVSVDGTKPTAAQPMALLLNHKAGKKTLLEVLRGGKTTPVTIQPLRPSARNGVLYDNWVKDNRALVDRLSSGRIGYVHIEAMDAPSLDVFLKEIQTQLNGKDGVLIDVRYNGGGFTSHIILNTMLKRPWLIRTQRDSDGLKLSENIYRGNALELPAACLTNQYSFSNAEIFSEGFRAMKLGPIIGESTAGAVIGTSAYRLWDGGSIRMPAAGSYALSGENLEGKGRRPDIEVKWDPNLALDGRDPMLEAAVKALLKQLPHH